MPIRENEKKYLKTIGMYEREYEHVAAAAVDELISRFYRDTSEEQYMTDTELFDYMIGSVRFSELHIYSFLALVCRLAAKKGFVVVSLPRIDPAESDSSNIIIKGYRYRAIPIHVNNDELYY